MRSAADVWEKVKKLMESGMTAVAIDTWFGDVEAVALEDTRLVLCVPTDFKLGIIRTRFQSGIEAALKELFSFDVDVALLLPEEREAYDAQRTAPSTAGGDAERYTFERFVVGSTNRFAYTAAKKVAEEPGGGLQPPVHLRPVWLGQDPSSPCHCKPGAAGQAGQPHHVRPKRGLCQRAHRQPSPGYRHAGLPGQIPSSGPVPDGRCAVHRRQRFQRRGAVPYL